MDKALSSSLVQLGCNDKHVRFYRANLQLGAATLPEIIKVARLHRSTGYLIGNEMIEMGLAIEDHKGYKKHFVAVEPGVVLRKLEAKQRQVGRGAIALKEALPEIRAAYHASSALPSVRTFEGKAGLIAVWRDILEEKQEIMLWSNQSTEQHIFDSQAHEQFIAERVAKGISIRVLAVNDARGKALIAGDFENLRQTKLLPPDMTFTSETYIYGNKVAVLDFGKRIFGVITQNDQIAKSQRAQFELAWRSAR
jgi:sugar-specific transcriptional regulator TrmB